MNYKPFKKTKGEKPFVQTISTYDTDRHRYTEKKYCIVYPISDKNDIVQAAM